MDIRGDIDCIRKYVRAANYLSAIQIYLQDNFLLKNKLSFDHIKPRPLGHWGTCPGINFVYANLNYLIKKHNLDMMFILGPGHGFPALQSNLFIEGSLRDFYPKAVHDYSGVSFIAKEFSWPFGFPSHSNPGAPGVILEGGELGYSLSTAYGAVLDNPNLIVACLIGDGEAETGALSASWNLNKFLNTSRDGIVLPILHLNGYKISGPSIFGRMSDKDISSFFLGLGYEPFFVGGEKIYEDMVDVLESCYKKIQAIKKSNKKNKFPLIVLRTPKGWTGIKELNNLKIEGNCLSHQVVAKNAKSNLSELYAIESWLKSYNFNDLFSADSGFCSEIMHIIPKKDLCMGVNKNAFANYVSKDIKLPDVSKFSESVSRRGIVGSSSMRRIGDFLNGVFVLNKNNFRLFSPDETYSNKLDAVFKSTSRVFSLPIKKWDKDISDSGRVMEILSEHCLQGMAQGYVLTGRHIVFASYEAFIEIVSSMADQFEKFLRGSRDFSWRGDVPSFNYLLTSSGWRQEHNGFSHQNPKFVSGMLQKPSGLANVFFPPDGNSSLVVMKKCLESKDCINIIVAGKTVEPRWLSISEAEKEFNDGLMIWDFASDKSPDIIFCGVGDYLTKECLAAIDLLKSAIPKIRIRFVNVMLLTSVGFSNIKFSEFFTNDKPVIFNYHGYPADIKALLFDIMNHDRFLVNGYVEHGSTTTPFDMHIRNGTSRFHLVIQAVDFLFRNKVIKKSVADELIYYFREKINEHHYFIINNGVDMPEVDSWTWKRNV